MSNRTIFDSPHALAILADALNDVGEPVFFGRRFLRYRDLVAIGLINNRMTLWRSVRAGRFPPPIYNTPHCPLWDAVELAGMLRQRAAERSLNNHTVGEKEMSKCVARNARGPTPPASAPQEKVP
jgi:hypothetical protein